MGDFTNDRDSRQRYGSSHQDGGSAARQAAQGPHANAPYRRTTRHITQDPITDDSLRAPAGTQQAPRPSGGNRKHMGVATSDPQYLPVLEPENARTRTRRPHAPAHERTGEERVSTPNYSRYLETPKSRRPIFQSRQDRARRRTTALLLGLLVVAIVLIAVWLIFLR